MKLSRHQGFVKVKRQKKSEKTTKEIDEIREIVEVYMLLVTEKPNVENNIYDKNILKLFNNGTLKDESLPLVFAFYFDKMELVTLEWFSKADTYMPFKRNYKSDYKTYQNMIKKDKNKASKELLKEIHDMASYYASIFDLHFNPINGLHKLDFLKIKLNKDVKFYLYAYDPK